MSAICDWIAVPQCDLCGGAEFVEYLHRGVDGAQLTRCSSCGLVILNPRPNAEGIAAWYGQEYFSADTGPGMGAGYLDFAEAGIRHGTEGFFQLASRVRLRGKRLLEVGCGGGSFLVQCRNAGADVAGLDISPFAAERLRQKYGVDVRVGVVETAPFDPSSFDIVAFTDVIEHVPSPVAFLRGINSLLKPGGQVYGLLPNLDCVAHYGEHWAGFRLHPEHLYYFGESQLDRCIRAAGFRTHEIWTWGEPWEPGPTKDSVPTPQQNWREWLRRIPAQELLVRAARRARVFETARQVRAWLRPEVRQRHARYVAGQGHNLYLVADRA